MPEDLAQWRIAAVGKLFGLRNPDGGWPYRAGSASGLEPTALAALALAGTGAGADILAATADWLIARQQQDGFFTASPPNEVGSWLTPLGALAGARLGRLAGVEEAAEALLGAAVHTFNQRKPNIYGYDTTLTGWPWSVGALSFVEPTALAVLFLKQAGYGGHDRVHQGVGLLRNRALPEGGWNYGEPEVLGGRLYPAEAPTALALLALSDEQDEQTVAALSWLQGRLGQITSLYSLGWTAIALNVLKALTVDWQNDVITRWRGLPSERHDTPGTALCLLGLREAEGHPFGLV